MTKSEEIRVRRMLLKIQMKNLINRYNRQVKRDKFVKRHLKKILSLSTNGWPRLNNMPNKNEWIVLVYKAKMEGIYGLGTSNCDVVIQLSRFAKEIKNNTQT